MLFPSDLLNHGFLTFDMKFKDKYTLDKTMKDEEDKVQLSPDAYGISDMIQDLINKIEHTRVSLIR